MRHSADNINMNHDDHYLSELEEMKFFPPNLDERTYVKKT